MISIRLKLAGATLLLLFAGYALFVGGAAFLLEPYYVGKIESELRKTLVEIRAAPGDSRSLMETIGRIGADTGYRIVIADSEGKVALSSAPEFRSDDAEPLPKEELDAFMTHRAEIEKGSVYTGLVKTTGGGQSVVELVASLPDGSFVVATQPLDRLSHSVRTVSGFFLAVASALLVLQAAVAFIAAKSIVSPIIALTDIAKRIAALDFSARYGRRRGDEIGSLGSSIDIMAEELAEKIAKLSQANERVVSEMQRQKDMLAAVSHEFKTPAGLMRGYAEALKLGMFETDAEREDLADVIIREADHIDSLVRDLAIVGAPESRPLAIAARSVDVAAVAERAVKRFSGSRRKGSARIRTECAAAVAVADEDRIVQVLDNYLANAVRHTPSGGTISVRVRPESRCAVIEVENEGEPIPEESLSRLYEPFYRTDASRSRDSGGSGLGLAVVKTIVQAHGGACGVRNAERGSVFWASFPETGPVAPDTTHSK